MIFEAVPEDMYSEDPQVSAGGHEPHAGAAYPSQYLWA